MPRPRSNDKRDKKFSAPASETEVKAFNESCKKVDVVPAETLRKLAAAWVLHVKDHGYAVTPIRLAGPPKKSN